MKLLEEAKDVGTVKRVVFVSSIGAVIGSMINCSNKTYTEEDWPDASSVPFKCRGKLNVCRDFVLYFPTVNFHCKLTAYCGITSTHVCICVIKPV